MGTSIMNGNESEAITKVQILGKDSIHVGYGLIPHIIDTCLSSLPSSTYVLITDTNIAPLYLDQFSQAINAALVGDLGKYPKLPKGSRFLSKVITPGEASKSRDTKADLEDWMLSHRCTRDTVILALGKPSQFSEADIRWRCHRRHDRISSCYFHARHHICSDPNDTSSHG